MPIKEEIENLIADGQTKAAVAAYLAYAASQDSKKHQQAIQLSNRYKQLESKKIKGTLKPDDLLAEEARITDLLLIAVNAGSLNAPDQPRPWWLYAVIGLFMVCILGFLVWNQNNRPAMQSIQGRVYVNGEIQEGVSVRFENYAQTVLTDELGQFTVSIENYQASPARFQFGGIDTLIEVGIADNVFQLSAKKENPADEKLMKEKEDPSRDHNEINNSDRSVIQTGDNSQAEFN